MIRPGAPEYIKYMGESPEKYNTRYEKVTKDNGFEDSVAVSYYL